MTDPTQTCAWKAWRAHHEEVGELLFDYSKNCIADETLALLTELCEQCGVRDWIAPMFSGDAINETEGRAVLHTALRNRGEHNCSAAQLTSHYRSHRTPGS